MLDGVGNRTAVTGSPDPGAYTMNDTIPGPADFQMNQYTNTPFDISRSYDENGNRFKTEYDKNSDGIADDVHYYIWVQF